MGLRWRVFPVLLLFEKLDRSGTGDALPWIVDQKNVSDPSLRLVATRAEPTSSPAVSSRARWAWLVAGAAAALVAYGLHLATGSRALQELPSDERAILYARSLEDLQTLCAAPRARITKDHCRELASLLSQLDECRGTCRTMVEHQLAPDPTR